MRSAGDSEYAKSLLLSKVVELSEHFFFRVQNQRNDTLFGVIDHGSGFELFTRC